MSGFNNSEYEDWIRDLVELSFYKQNSQSERIESVSMLSMVVLRKLFDIPKSNESFGLPDLENRMAEKPIELLPPLVNKLSDSQSKTFSEAVDLLNSLYAVLFIDYFLKYKFGTNARILSVFSLLPPVVRYIALKYLYEKEPDNKSVIDKYALAILKTFDKDKAFEWIEAERNNLEAISAYDENYPFDLANRFGTEVATKILSSTPQNMYKVCLEKIQSLANQIEINNGNLYNTFEEALPLYIEKGRIEGETDEILKFNSLMEFCYIGRRAKDFDVVKKQNKYVVSNVLDTIELKKSPEKKHSACIESFGVENFRSLSDSSLQQIKPLTILVGKNSSGKSSFLRLFPMLKQSIERQSLGALALYGEDVDFGDFRDVLTKGSKKDYLVFSFKGVMGKHSKFLRSDSRKADSKSLEYSLRIQIKNSENLSYLYISDYDLSIGNEGRIQLSISDSGFLTNFTVNGIPYNSDMKKIRFSYAGYQHSIFPVIHASDGIEGQSNFFYKPFLSLFDNSLQIYRILENFDIAFLQDKDSALELIESAIAALPNESNNGKIKERLYNSKSRDLLYSHLIFAKFEELYMELGYTLATAFDSIYYSKPLRANTERYYRNQPLSVNEIAADGSNLLHFYSNFSSAQKHSFRRWLSENFGFGFEVAQKGNLRSIMINDDGQEHNIVDVGYGYSQILPIIMQLWSITRKRNAIRATSDIIYVIEQPELHLHPGMQQKLLKAFVDMTKLARRNGMNIRFVLETHSKTFIDALGDLVSAKKISSDEIQIMVFNKTNGQTNIQNTSFDSDGNLHNWPIGFFG